MGEGINKYRAGMRVSRPARPETDYINTRSTEEGYSEGLRRAILTAEAQDRKIKTHEVARVFDADGRQTAYREGDNKRHGKAYRQVDLTGIDAKDKVVTHNHPYQSIDKKLGGWASIGSSHSEQDVIYAVTHDAREIRATTGTYTFSMKRPAGGWNATAAQVKNAYKTARAKILGPMKVEGWRINTDYQLGRISETEAQARLDNLNRRYAPIQTHAVNKEVARMLGFRYSKKRG